MGFSGTASSTSGRFYGARFQPSRDMHIKSATFRVTVTATTNDPVEVVILDSTGARIATSGSVSSLVNSTGTKVIALPSVLVKGQNYYACLLTVSTGTAASLRRVTIFGDAFGTAFPQAETWYMSGQTIPVGASVTGVTSTDSVPLLVLREFA